MILPRLGWLALIASVLLPAGLLQSCTRNSAPSGQGALADRGRVIYQTNCISCHNPDPKKPGSIGPELHGSSRELLEARVVRGSYPTGYTPKRATHTMAPLPYLKGELDAIHAYLNR